jgi:hypothetical protein
MKKIIVFICCIIVISCQKIDDETDSIIPDSNVFVSNEMMVFKTPDDYLNTMEFLMNKSEDKITIWEQSMNFVSFNSICEKIYDEIVSASYNNIEEVKKVVAENSK